jgi:hypothetical protein
VTVNKTPQKDGTGSKQIVSDTLKSEDSNVSFNAPPVTSYPTDPVLEETVTSFSASSVKSQPTAQVIEETIQKEEKSKSYTVMSGHVEERITSFSTQQPTKTTEVKR